MRRRSQPLRIAIDTGGTFTDCIWIDAASGRLRMLKVFSTPADPSLAIAEALRKIGHPGPLVLLHGTTVGTNTILERKGARTALVTTAGFEDVIEIGRQARPRLYDFFFDRIEPLVAKELRFGVGERVSSDGEILKSPGEDEVKTLLEKVAASRPESIAVSFLFSFANPHNELKVVQELEALGLPISASHRILPEFREYERTSTVVINAYLQPILRRYLKNLERKVGGEDSSQGEGERSRTSARIFVMQSSGGIASLDTAAREPVRTVLSGPAGGVTGAAASARRSGFERIIAFDMGGTSTDVSLVEKEITMSSSSEIAGLPLGVPTLDIQTVGAGGGSLARFDAGGLLRVGPESAGADPGPICYGRGAQPTVTDANLLLGRLRPELFLGGDFRLEVERTRQVTREWLKKQGSQLSLEKFAAGVVRVVNATMEKALRVVSIERGRDPREFALVAFGGAGGLHACALAESLGIPHVIVPAMPGALSAYGILMSDVVKDYSQTVLWRVRDRLPFAELRAAFAKLEKGARRDFRSENWPGKIRIETHLDLRYRGQGYELNLPFSKSVLREFEKEHRRRYGYAHAGREIEIVTLRLRAVVKSAGSQARFPQGKRGETAASTAGVLFGDKKVRAAVFVRDGLTPERRYSGPAIVTEYSATTVIPPGRSFHIDRAGNLNISLIVTRR
ncbi:MAG TPA: hydantoinase/oxoprolinase family protein [Candidatus Binatia bacterium]|nr:hydantoinase/oxoprolinase family protein [Candidatus Binatia bacterium]